jgi:hypothetical protein
MPFSDSVRALTVFLSFMTCLVGVASAEGPAVIHSSAADSPRQTWELEELWRLGGESDEHVFGLMIQAFSDDAGYVYLLDQQLSRVTMVSPDGQYVAELGGEGDGPGECRTPQAATLMPDGTVGLGQRFPGRFIKVDRQGNPAGNVDIGGENSPQTGFTMLVTGLYRGGTLLVGSLRQIPAETGQSRDSNLQRISPEGEVLAEFATASTYLDFGKPHFLEREMVAPFLSAHTVGPDGRVYLASERNSYAIEVYSPEGVLEKTITRDFKNPRRPQRTTDRLNALFEEQDRALPFRITWEVEPSDQTVGELIVLADGSLLVASSRTYLDLPEGIFCRYDVFDSRGRWSHELDISCRASQDHDGLIFLDDGRVLLVKGLQMARLTASGNGGTVSEEDDAEEVMEIICCRPVLSR